MTTEAAQQIVEKIDTLIEYRFGQEIEGGFTTALRYEENITQLKSELVALLKGEE